MDADERDIAIYLKQWPGHFISIREIARRAGGKRRFQADPDWATQVLLRMVEKGWVEADPTRGYRLVRKPKPKTGNRWVSPHIQNILQQSGKQFDDLRKPDDGDEFAWLDEV